MILQTCSIAFRKQQGIPVRKLGRLGKCRTHRWPLVRLVRKGKCAVHFPPEGELEPQATGNAVIKQPVAAGTVQDYISCGESPANVTSFGADPHPVIRQDWDMITGHLGIIWATLVLEFPVGWPKMSLCLLHSSASLCWILFLSFPFRFTGVNSKDTLPTKTLRI